MEGEEWYAGYARVELCKGGSFGIKARVTLHRNGTYYDRLNALTPPGALLDSWGGWGPAEAGESGFTITPAFEVLVGRVALIEADIILNMEDNNGP